MQYEEIIAMVREVSKLGLSSFDYTEGNIHISMNFPWQIQEKETVAEAPRTEVGQEQPESGEVMRAPLVGTYYSAPAEGAEPYIRVGEPVKKGQVLGLIEAMKLMNEIECERDGVITEILVADGQPVEYGQPLFRIGQGSAYENGN